MKANGKNLVKHSALQTRLDVLILLQAMVLASLLLAAMKLNF